MWSDMVLMYMLGLAFGWVLVVAIAAVVGARVRARRDWDEAFERELTGVRL